MHIGLIPDGNRRWAKHQGLDKIEGHKEGAKRIKEFLVWCKNIEVEEISVFILSSENIKNRGRDEIEGLKRILLKAIDEYRDLLEEYDIHFVGEYSLLGKQIEEKIRDLMNESESISKKRMRVNFLVGYGGRWEIEQAHKNKGEIKDNLYIKRDLDLIIRTGKEKRISNFLLYQAAYAEIYFCDKFWPAFDKQDFDNILHWFNKRERRFGA